MSRESPATLYAVEDEVEKAFIRKKSFFNKKASKSSILTVRKVLFFPFFSILLYHQNDGNEGNSPMARTSPSPNDTGLKQQTYNNLNTQLSNESNPTKRTSRMQKG